MSTIQFCTTPKGYLQHYYYIFRKSEPLGTDMNNVAADNVTPRYLKENEAMKTSKFQNYIGGTICA